MKRFLKTILSVVLVASLSLSSFALVKSDKMNKLEKTIAVAKETLVLSK